ncbi:MAG: hypothetical protein WC799_24745 [Desulfobacteraceae bacterium]|jgi:hypothetical protein
MLEPASFIQSLIFLSVLFDKNIYSLLLCVYIENMNFLKAYNDLIKKEAESKKRKTPQEIDAELLKLAQSDPNVTVDYIYLTNGGEPKGHKFTLANGPVITTRFDEGDREGSVACFDPTNHQINEGQKGRKIGGFREPLLGG